MKHWDDWCHHSTRLFHTGRLTWHWRRFLTVHYKKKQLTSVCLRNRNASLLAKRLADGLTHWLLFVLSHVVDCFYICKLIWPYPAHFLTFFTWLNTYLLPFCSSTCRLHHPLLTGHPGSHLFLFPSLGPIPVTWLCFCCLAASGLLLVEYLLTAPAPWHHIYHTEWREYSSLHLTLSIRYILAVGCSRITLKVKLNMSDIKIFTSIYPTF